MKPQYYSPRGTLIIEEEMIWCDRLAITLFIIVTCIAVPIYILGNDASAFYYFEIYVSVPVAAFWFACRAIDFFVTGRIR